MFNLFSGFEKFGLNKVSDIEMGNKKKEEEKLEAKKREEKVTEESLVYDKTMECPICGEKFQTKAIRAGKNQLVSQDTDLRPRYNIVDTIKYDAVVCPKCGYGSLTSYFKYATPGQIKMIKENISSKFTGIRTDMEIFSYDDALERYKYALLSCMVKRTKLSETAYVCLKMAWALRGKSENLPKDTKDIERLKAEIHKEELELIEKAYDGFSQAFSKESFPICGMKEDTLTYLVADLARQLGKYSEANRWCSAVITSRNATDRIKEKARNLKNQIKEEVDKVDESKK